MSIRVGILSQVCLLQGRLCVPMSPVPQSSNTRTSYRQRRDQNSSKTGFFVLCLYGIKRWQRGASFPLSQSLQKILTVLTEQIQKAPTELPRMEFIHSFNPNVSWAGAIIQCGRIAVGEPKTASIQEPC